ncbi:MAG: hypothetical protein ABL957_09775 [Parvularculaceae bacterium]
MADILIRKVSDATKERLAEAAARAGASLEAFLRQVLDEKAAETPRPNDDDRPFGTWAVALFADVDPEARKEFLRNLDEIEYWPEHDQMVFEDD